MSGKGPWIIAAAVVIAAVLIIAAQFYFREQDRKCEEWQAQVRALADVADMPVTAFVDTKNRPEGCPLP